MSKIRRKRIWIDGKTQGQLAMRAIGYWFFCLVGVILMLSCSAALSGQARSSNELLGGVWLKATPAVLGTVILLPIVILDILRLSHRFVGPIIRLQRGLQEIHEGQVPERIHLREHDFFKDVADDFNLAVDTLERARSTAPTQLIPDDDDTIKFSVHAEDSSATAKDEGGRAESSCKTVVM